MFIFRTQSFILLAISLLPANAPAAENELQVSLSSDSVGIYQRIEISVTGVGDYNTPMNPAVVKLDAELISPSGKTVVAPGFCMHKMVAGGSRRTPKYQPEGDWLWKIRYMPNQTGTYKGKAVVTDKSGRRESKEFSFNVSESDSHGVIRVAKGNRYAFEYEDGTPYVAIGHNLSWVNGDRVVTYKQYLDKMAANGCNFIRVWLGAEWCFGIEGSRPYSYSEDAAYLMDQVLEMCEERDIAIKVCFEQIRRFEKVRNMGNVRLDYPYMKANGGPCETLEDFITKDEAKIQWKALQRYIVARWGASTSIFAWELWNEFNETDFFRAAEYPENTKDYMLATWTEEMCANLKQTDPHRHMTTNSLGSGGRYNSIWHQPSVDFAQYHDYASWPWNKGKVQYEVYGEPLQWLRQATGKPVLLAECGMSPQEMQQDPNGYAFHEALWVGFMAGGAGSAHHWWWDSVIDPMNLYPQYAPFAKFVSDIPVNKEPFPPAYTIIMPDNLRCYARQASWGAIAWVVNRNNGWRELVEQKKPVETVSGAQLILPQLPIDGYHIIFFDTRTGKIIEETATTIEGMRQPIILPDFKVDIAVKIIRVSH